MTAWLKVIGTSSSPLRNDWTKHAPSLLQYASFAKRPGMGSWVRGDEFVYYALRGDLSRVVAVGRVVGPKLLDTSRIEDPGWPWLVEVEIDAKCDLIGDGFELDLLDVARELKRSVQRRSHLRLSPEEFDRARLLFGSS